MAAGQSARNGKSVEPGLPNTFVMPKARSRLNVASLTVRDLLLVLAGLRDDDTANSSRVRKKVARHVRACSGHPRLHGGPAGKTWMAGTSPAMTTNWNNDEQALPRRDALHGRLAFRIRGPQLHAAGAVVIGIDRELA